MRLRSVVAAALVLFTALPASASTPFVNPALVWDSGVITSGATSVSTVRSLGAYTDLEVFVDNTSGGGWRDLTMTTFAPDGVTTVDSVLLKRVPWGGVPTAGIYAQGRARGYVGPLPPGVFSDYFTLYEATSATSGSLDSTPIDVSSCDALVVDVFPNAAVSGVISLFSVNDTSGADSAEILRGTGFDGTGTRCSVGLGGGCIGAQTWAKAGGAQIPSRRMRVAAAAGSGGTVRVHLGCRGRAPGTFAHQMVLPTRAQFSVSAANGTAHVWVIGR